MSLFTKDGNYRDLEKWLNEKKKFYTIHMSFESELQAIIQTGENESSNQIKTFPARVSIS